ncbi:hypothetical protein H8I69_15020 [Serratia fonticola]|uniref:hypothetical protein n=1 Tax=Serratia fonticola TaxID=47917 RepID=UPI0015C589C2|nr:hypothetical protein [Serratia fonticola]MBC3380427.1 hypothetical protein [Serratia fonticola]NYA39626.1 hypothetical protein [Serratia fonticola]
MVKDRGISASQQGDLDCLCGAYSLVNMMGYLFDGKVKRKPLMRALLREYSYEWPLEEWLTHGLDEPRMDYLIDRVLRQGYYHKHFPTQISQPFRELKRLTTLSILTAMTEYLNHSDFSRLILISDQHHWSVITRIDSQYLYFFDSSGRRKSPRKSWSLKPGNSSHQLFPDCIYFVEREF